MSCGVGAKIQVSTCMCWLVRGKAGKEQKGTGRFKYGEKLVESGLDERVTG